MNWRITIAPTKNALVSTVAALSNGRSLNMSCSTTFTSALSAGPKYGNPRIALMGGFQGGRRALFTVLK